MENCIFCRIAKKEAPANIVFEDDQKMAFLELNQSAPGHVMVILKKHGKSIYDYNQEELGKLTAGVQKVAEKVQKGMKADWLSIGINHEEKHGVPHLHIHVIPRWENDRGGIIQTIVNTPVEESRESITKKIKNAD